MPLSPVRILNSSSLTLNLPRQYLQVPKCVTKQIKVQIFPGKFNIFRYQLLTRQQFEFGRKISHKSVLISLRLRYIAFRNPRLEMVHI